MTYGRYGYRRIAALLRAAGWTVNARRVRRIWRRQGLTVPQRQPKRGADNSTARNRHSWRARRDRLDFNEKVYFSRHNTYLWKVSIHSEGRATALSKFANRDVEAIGASDRRGEACSVNIFSTS